MKVCSFYDDSTQVHQIHLHGDITHLHIHYTNTQLQLTRDASNTDVTVVLKHLGALFQHVPFDLITGYELFQSFISILLHQYDEVTYHDTSDSDSDPDLPYHHSTMHPRTHRSITTSVIEWIRLRHHMNVDRPDLLTYTHGLVSSLSPVNYTRATMNVIDHIYIGILPRSTHALMRQYFSLFVTQQQQAHDRRFPRSRTILHIMSVYWDHIK